MIQKKVCMVGVQGTGKTSMVKRFVHSIFTERYHSTVGVKLDRKVVAVGGVEVTLLLWDIEGRSEENEVPASYTRGAHAVLYVADGTRRTTFEQLRSLRALVRATVGDVPSLVALNKADLAGEWALTRDDEAALPGAGLPHVRTSAKTGAGVDDAFHWIATEVLRVGAARS
ncbi:Rab family GTPase [Roseisolibacter sp. H3M3-2]|uniref:Rab family GTPase n=1 Tax=Roseisolibacter sp. H3M3-2 TaxID=3031323 RepID=UPI0023DAE7D9|nr:Rab family GTPase [Roseisolibacter sp. H3M3-2]MDF1503299.1 GTP-binding protein [Roseisolibacter sp. H3M3-2]